MKQFTSLALVASVLASCGFPSSSSANLSYAVKAIAFNGYRASMSTIDSDKEHGGGVALRPLTQASTDVEVGSYFITTDDPHGKGVVDNLTVCGYIPRYDGKPSGCETLSRDSVGGWHYSAVFDKDKGMVSVPSQPQIAYWVREVTLARAQLLRATPKDELADSHGYP